MPELTYLEAQVAEFFAERGLLPIVPARHLSGAGRPRIHAALPDTPFTPLCHRARNRGQVMRSATGHDLANPPCRGCTTEHIHQRDAAALAALEAAT